MTQFHRDEDGKPPISHQDRQVTWRSNGSKPPPTDPLSCIQCGNCTSNGRNRAVNTKKIFHPLVLAECIANWAAGNVQLTEIAVFQAGQRRANQPDNYLQLITKTMLCLANWVEIFYRIAQSAERLWAY
jgi:hypothetical protein